MDLKKMILRSDVEGFNRHRRNNPDIDIILSSELFGQALMLDGINLSGVDLRDSRFVDCALVGSMFCGADLRRAVFVECFLDDALFRQAYLSDAVFVRCSMERVDFIDINVGINKEKEIYRISFVQIDPVPIIVTHEEIQANEGQPIPSLAGSYRFH